MKRSLPVLAASVLMLGMAVAPQPAFAVPNYCSAVQSGNGADAYCYTSASGTQFRAVAYCRYYISSTGTYDYDYYDGVWRIQGDPQHSLAMCGTGWQFLSPNAQTK